MMDVQWGSLATALRTGLLCSTLAFGVGCGSTDDGNSGDNGGGGTTAAGGSKPSGSDGTNGGSNGDGGNGGTDNGGADNGSGNNGGTPTEGGGSANPGNNGSGDGGSDGGASGGDDNGGGDNGSGNNGDGSTTTDPGAIDDCGRYLVTYQLDGSSMRLAETPGGIGADTPYPVTNGSAQVLFESDGNGGLANGPVRLVFYSGRVQANVMNMITADVTSSAGPEPCGSSTGTFDGTAMMWDEDVEDFHTSGNITCSAGPMLCPGLGLQDGTPTPVDNTRSVTLNTMTVTTDGATNTTSFSMEEMEIPNDLPGRAFMTLQGQELERQCMPSPDSCD